MEFVAYALVVISAFTHAYWNFVLKRSGGGHVFIGLSKIAEIALFGLPFVYLLSKNEIAILDYWPFYVVGAVLVIANYYLLDQAYRRGDLSLVYPVSRAGALLFLPILAFLFIGETIDAIGVIAISLIFFGLLVVQLTSFTRTGITSVGTSVKNPATILAILAAFIVACYTLWDKYSISLLPPFIYFYAYTLLVGLSYGVFILVKYPSDHIKNEWVKRKYSILQVGFLNTFTYLLVLYSLQTGKASYVVALRQLSIVFGVFLGWKILREQLLLPKKIGILFLIAGCLLISSAR